MSFDLLSAADDFMVNLNVQTTLGLPTARESILHFCETAQKQFPQMTAFYQRDTGEYVLEGDREGGSYPWLEIQTHQLAAGYFSPPDLERGYHLHRWLLERSVYYLGISGLDVQSLDVLFGFNLDYRGNRDAIAAEALLGGSPLVSLLGEGEHACIEFEPGVVVALDEGCFSQARLAVETRSSSYQVRTGQYENEPISVYLTVRQYAQPGRLMDLKATFKWACETCEDLAERLVVPHVVRAIAAAIAAQ